MKIIVRNPNDDTNAKFKLKALADGIITVNAPAGAIIKNEDNEWLTCLSAASTLISCAGASNKLFVPFDFDSHIAARPAGLESFWDWSMNGGYGDTPYGGWEAVFNSMREDDKIVDWDIYVDEIKIGTTHIVPLSRLNESDPGYDENEMDLWFNEILSTVKGLGIYYPDALHPDEINADIETFFNDIVQTDGIDVDMPHKTIRVLNGIVMVNETNKPMRIKFVPSNPLVTMGNRWKAGFGIRPHSLTENYAYLLDLQPLAETIRGNDAVTVDPIDGSISICLEAASVEIPLISCAGAGSILDLRIKLHRAESGGAVYINDPITGDRIAEGFGYYADDIKPIASLITVVDSWKDKIAIVDNGNTFYNANFTLESSVGIINKTDAPLRLEVICETMSPVEGGDKTLTSMHVGDSTNAVVDEVYGDDIDVVNTCIAPPDVIEVNYDPFYQKMTITGNPGTFITTQDVDGNLLGNGNISSEGILEYTIDEDMLSGGAKLITSGMGTIIVEHNLVASLYVASDVEGQNVEFNVVRDNHLDWLGDYAGYEQGLSATLSGEMIVEYSTGESTIVNLEEHRGERWGFIVDELGVHDFNVAGTAKTGLVSAKVRFRNLNDKVHVVLAQATHVYKFFDDGLSEVSYSLVSRDSRPYVKLKQIPTYLPSTMRSLNTMFWGDGSDSYVFETAEVEAALANWDVSNIESMSSTFAYSMYHSLPIGNWTPTNLKYMTGTFGYATWDTAINWDTPALLDTSFAFEGSTFNSALMLSMGQVIKAECMFIDNTTFMQDISKWCVTNLTVEPMDFNRDGVLTPEQLPVWGTCPRGENVAPPEADEMYFTTTAGSIDYVGQQGDQIILSDGGIVDITDTNLTTAITVPAGKHKVKLINVIERNNYVSVGGEALVELHNFPTLSTVTKFNFATDDYNNLVNLTTVPTVLPTNITDVSDMFAYADIFNQDIGMWDITHVNNTSLMFRSAIAFNQDISGWDVSNVTNMSGMFDGAVTFNQPLAAWDVSNVTNIAFMFIDATSFNQPVGNWNVSNVIDMFQLFRGATAFNQPLASWDVSKVTNMTYLFFNATSFNQDLSQWCVSAFAEAPMNFAIGSALIAGNLPVWGTCPTGIE